MFEGEITAVKTLKLISLEILIRALLKTLKKLLLNLFFIPRVQKFNKNYSEKDEHFIESAWNFGRIESLIVR